MTLGRALLLALALVAASATGAAAHRLKLFASVAGTEVTGYGFFVGGGRPAGVAIVARDAAGAEIWRGTTGDDGSFAFTVTRPEALTLTLDAGDGHAVTETLSADRFGAAPAATPAPVAVATSTPTDPPAAARDDAALAALIAVEVDKSVARQLRPLLEAQAAAEARVRLNDILGGLGWIAGLVGVGLTVAHRRRR